MIIPLPRRYNEALAKYELRNHIAELVRSYEVGRIVLEYAQLDD